MSNFQIGLIGLGVMGRNLALNWRDHGVEVFGYDIDIESRQRFEAERAGRVFDDISELIAVLPRPRMLCLLIPAGEPVKQRVEILFPLLAAGDIIVDAGNSHYRDTEALQARLASSGITLLGIGLSGGERGARHGPAMMAGGDLLAIQRVTPLFEPIVAHAADGSACFTVVGPGGAGHFAKMMHNGIEYADMQLIAEVVYLMRHLGGLAPAEIAEVLATWNRGELASYLLEVSIEVLAAKDVTDGEPLIDKIVDVASQKGTGQWAVTAAMELGVSVPSIAAAVFARCQSACIEERRMLVQALPCFEQVRKSKLLTLLHDAMVGGRIAAFAQGFSVIAAASQAYEWNSALGGLARGWRGGCIIRARLLEDIADCFDLQPNLLSLLLDSRFAMRIRNTVQSWREVLSLAVKHELPVPIMSASLAWLDTFSRDRLWTDLIQGQRDCFGSHGFRRIDMLGSHHFGWKMR